jgi:hypothetical protein
VAPFEPFDRREIYEPQLIAYYCRLLELDIGFDGENCKKRVPLLVTPEADGILDSKVCSSRISLPSQPLELRASKPLRFREKADDGRSLIRL